jgi:hypothetical protein
MTSRRKTPLITIMGGTQEGEILEETALANASSASLSRRHGGRGAQGDFTSSKQPGIARDR